MDKARLEKLSKIMNVVKKDFVSSTDVKSFLYSIITFAKENKQELENLSKEYLQTINEAIEDIENQNKTLLENVSNKTAQNQTDFESQVKELKEILKKVKAIKTTKPADGIDGVNPNPEDVVPLVLEKLPKQEEIIGEKIVDKINALSLDDENKIDASHIKNLPEPKSSRIYGTSGIKEIIAGDNITVDNSNLGYPVISSTGSTETFESVSKNIKSYPYTIAYSGGDVSTITYDLGGGLEVVKTFGYTSGDVTTVTLSGDTPAGIDLIKTISYSGGAVDNIVYS